MEQLVTSNFRLGIIAGGQLGKMLVLAASNWDVKTFVLDPDPTCPASGVCTQYLEGSYQDYETVLNFGRNVDMLTFDIENININALIQLKKEGVRVHPEPEVLMVIQDKGLQKEFYAARNIPTSAFRLFGSKEEILKAIAEGSVHFPFVQKLRTSGYDGKGVEVIRTEKELHKLMEGLSLLEDCVNIKKEVAVIAARNISGELNTFPMVEMEFNHEANLVERLICPSSEPQNIHARAEELAKEIISALGMTGILAIEYFVDKDGNLLVNEIAPRAHNSGHHTIESCITSQYEQQLRAIFGFPLGSTKIKIPSVMINLLGEKNHSGLVKYEGLTDCMSIEGTKIHIYGKRETKPFRKMGHATVLDPSIESAIIKSKRVIELLKVKSWNQ